MRSVTASFSTIFAALCAVAFVFASSPAAFAAAAKNVKCNGCVHAKDIANKAVNTNKIKPGAVTPNRLSLSARPGVVTATEENGATLLTASIDVTLRTATIVVPGPGAVIATGGLYVEYHNAGNNRVACTVSQGTTVVDEIITISQGPEDQYDSISQTRTFTVAAQGPVDVNLVCRRVTGLVEASDPTLTLLFVPQAQNVISE